MNKKTQITICLFLIFNFQKVVFGQTAGSVTSGNWYRIAYNTGDRANAEFTLRDFISSGGHSTVNFRVGTSFNHAGGVSFTLLNHSYFVNVTFSKIRILQKSTYDQQYLEVYVERTGSVNFSIYDNLQVNGWSEVSWTLGSIPLGYNSIEFSINNLFVVGGTQNNFTISRQGHVGIGTTSPVAKLQIQGENESILWIGGNNTNDTYLRIGNSSFQNGYSIIQSVKASGSTFGDIVINSSGGNVGIGTTTPDYKLDVLGTIRANEVKVATGWSDFVFKPEYNLKPLQEVEYFINQNGHLPDIPSAKEVEESGISLGEMDAKLLQKIEELTLYTLEQQKELKAQSKEIEELKAMVKALAAAK